jgi:hypothetical protein
MSDPTQGPKGQAQMQVQLDDQTAMGRYSNLMLVNHNENEFVMDFAYVLPGPPRARVVSRVIVSPKHMKRILKTLEQNLDKYEERFGEITPLEQGGETIVH